MKNYFKKFQSVLMITYVLVSGQTMAGPQHRPGPEVKLSDDAVLVTRLLRQEKVQICLEEINKNPLQWMLESITSQVMSPDLTIYNFSGLAILGGDVATGKINLKIRQEKVKGGFGMSPYTMRYECTVSLPELND